MEQDRDQVNGAGEQQVILPYQSDTDTEIRSIPYENRETGECMCYKKWAEYKRQKTYIFSWDWSFEMGGPPPELFPGMYSMSCLPLTPLSDSDIVVRPVPLQTEPSHV